MNHERIEAGSGWTWITEGWETFMKNPGIWIVMALIWWVIAFVLGWIPIVGGLVASLIGPALAGGMVFGARELEQGRSLEIPHLFQAFNDSSRTVPMLLLGLLPLAASFVSWIILGLIMGGVAVTGATTGSGAAAFAAMIGGFMVALVIWLILSFVVGAALLFAIPSVMLGGQEPLPAVQASFEVCMSNIGAFVVFVLIMFGFSLLAMIPFGLGYLVLLPVGMGAVYAAYRQVLGGAHAPAHPGEAAEQTESRDEEPPPL